MRKGFTLIEVLVVIGIIIGLFAIGALVDSSSIGRQSLSSVESTLVSVLQKARSRAMNNIAETSHGVFIDSDKFVLFQGGSYDSGESTNEEISRSDAVAVTGLDEIIFTPLSGEATDGTITLTQGVQSREIEILEDGLINW